MTDHTIIILGGLYCLGFALFHTQFSRLFDWRNELAKLSPLNKGIMLIMNNRLIYFFLLVAAMCFFFTLELATTPLGHFLLVGISLFCLGRAIEQFIYIKSNHPLAHLLTYLFLLGAVLFAIPVLL